jgi:hypothetical protein
MLGRFFFLLNYLRCTADAGEDTKLLERGTRLGQDFLMEEREMMSWEWKFGLGLDNGNLSSLWQTIKSLPRPEDFPHE